MADQLDLFLEAPSTLLPRLIYVVIIKDRHSDVEAIPFYNKEEAIDYAVNLVRNYAVNPLDIDDTLNTSMKKAGWVYHATYSCEGDYISVREEKIR